MLPVFVNLKVGIFLQLINLKTTIKELLHLVKFNGKTVDILFSQ